MNSNDMHEKENEEIIRKLIRNIDYAKRKGKKEELNILFVHEEYRKVISILNEMEEIIYHSNHYDGVLVLSKNGDLENLRRRLQIKLGERIKVSGTSYVGTDNFLAKEQPSLLIGKAMKS